MAGLNHPVTHKLRPLALTFICGCLCYKYGLRITAAYSAHFVLLSYSAHTYQRESEGQQEGSKMVVVAAGLQQQEIKRNEPHQQNHDFRLPSGAYFMNSTSDLIQRNDNISTTTYCLFRFSVMVNTGILIVLNQTSKRKSRRVKSSILKGNRTYD